ncbi:MAG TPA: pyridoxamine 5'-phosphate oxidase [Chthoniobacteraceae bacterium]|nr:pyridoxamine 5'-phosphate oxidase [Chthoniobacteraceae bacterium]
MNISSLREEYSQRHLFRRDLDPDPIAQFNRWLAEAVDARIKDPNAMSLATVNAAGQPSARIVLLKGVQPGGFLFFTNYGSRKAADLEANPRAGLTFFWAQLERQVIIEGTVAKATREESDTYFHSRPLASQLGAWASRQSEIVPSRQYLEEKFDAVSAQYAEQQVPLPPFWGGYWVAPSSIEFWQGGPGRIHDRLRYIREGDAWRIERLSP